MNLLLKAAAFYLVDTGDTLTIEDQFEILKNYESLESTDDYACNVDGVNIWQPFEDETVSSILERIDELHTIYKEIYNTGFEDCKNGILLNNEEKIIEVKVYHSSEKSIGAFTRSLQNGKSWTDLVWFPRSVITTTHNHQLHGSENIIIKMSVPNWFLNSKVPSYAK